MNYIWDIVIRAINEDIPLEEIEFRLADSYSPYMELSLEDLNFSEVPDKVEINPFYRFFEIFKDYFGPDYRDYEELRRVLFDIITHFLAQVDLYRGMNKVEYHKRFLYKDIKKGCFGKKVSEDIESFSLSQKNIILNNLYKFNFNPNHIHFLKKSIKEIFNDCALYINGEVKDEILIYINSPDNEENKRKLDLIVELFLAINFDIKVYWEKHFGIIGIKETMKVEDIIIY